MNRLANPNWFFRVYKEFRDSGLNPELFVMVSDEPILDNRVRITWKHIDNPFVIFQITVQFDSTNSNNITGVESTYERKT